MPLHNPNDSKSSVTKSQEREKTIRSLRGDVQKLKDTLDETEEKMNIQDQTSRELQGLVETSSLALEEAKAKMCIKDQKLLDMETKLKETYGTWFNLITLL